MIEFTLYTILYLLIGWLVTYLVFRFGEVEKHVSDLNRTHLDDETLTRLTAIMIICLWLPLILWSTVIVIFSKGKL